MKKHLRSFELERPQPLDRREIQFLESLPPSFPLHFHSLANILKFKYYPETQSHEVLARYAVMIVRKLSLPFLIIVSLIYSLMKPYIFSMLLLLVIFGLFLSMNFSGISQIYKIFIIGVLVILLIRSISKQTVLYHYIFDFSNSVSQTQRDFNILSFIGMNTESSVIEIFVFLATVFYCVDRNSQVTGHTAEYYYNMYHEKLPGFPEDYCYTVVDNPIAALGLKSSYQPTYWKVIQKSLKQVGLIESFHHIYLLILDLVSFIWLAAQFDDWTSSEGSVSLIIFYTPIGVNTSTGYIFMLLVHVIFTFLCYYFQIALSSVALYFLNLIWFLLTIIIVFFVVRSESLGTPVSAILYFIIRYIYHLILSHKIRTGTSFVSFKIPDFQNHYKFLKFSNLFLRYFPFAFELSTLLQWMSRRTNVSFSDYLAVCDI